MEEAVERYGSLSIDGYSHHARLIVARILVGIVNQTCESVDDTRDGADGRHINAVGRAEVHLIGDVRLAHQDSLFALFAEHLHGVGSAALAADIGNLYIEFAGSALRSEGGNFVFRDGKVIVKDLGDGKLLKRNPVEDILREPVESDIPFARLGSGEVAGEIVRGDVAVIGILESALAEEDIGERS